MPTTAHSLNYWCAKHGDLSAGEVLDYGMGETMKLCARCYIDNKLAVVHPLGNHLPMMPAKTEVKKE